MLSSDRLRSPLSRTSIPSLRSLKSLSCLLAFSYCSSGRRAHRKFLVLGDQGLRARVVSGVVLLLRGFFGLDDVYTSSSQFSLSKRIRSACSPPLEWQDGSFFPTFTFSGVSIREVSPVRGEVGSTRSTRWRSR